MFTGYCAIGLNWSLARDGVMLSPLMIWHGIRAQKSLQKLTTSFSAISSEKTKRETDGMLTNATISMDLFSTFKIASLILIQ